MQNSKTITETIANQITKSEYQRQVDAIRLFPQAVRAASSLGMEKDEAVHGAVRAVAVITGVNVTELFHVQRPSPIPSSSTNEKYLTLGAIGRMFKTNVTGATKRLRAIGLLDSSNSVTEAGRAFYIDYKGWSEKVIELLQAAEDGR